MNNTEQPSAAGKVAHTPTPWSVNLASVISESGLHICAVDGYGMTREQNAANRAFIVQACNSYHSDQVKIKELTEALELSKELIESNTHRFPKSIRHRDTFQLNLTRAVINKALLP